MDNLIKLLRDDAAAYRKSVYDPDPEKVDVMFTLDYQWIDKPHRHVGDLCGKLDKAADALEAQASEIEVLRNETAKLCGLQTSSAQPSMESEMECFSCGRKAELRFGCCFDCATKGEEVAAKRTVLRHLSQGVRNAIRRNSNAKYDFRWAWERLTKTGDYAPGGYFEAFGIPTKGE